jgi:hypothetical protein
MPKRLKRLLCAACLLSPALGSATPIDITSWTASGTVGNMQVLTALGPLSPTGMSFVLLSTGAGSINTPPVFDTTELESPGLYTVEPSAFITIRYNFITAEPNDGSGFPDTFSIDVLGLSPENIASDTVNMGMTPIVLGPAVATDGSTFVNETGWNTITVSLAAFTGQSIGLRFSVADAIDNSFDSGLLVDSVEATGLVPVANNTVPEPSSLLLVLTCIVVYGNLARCPRQAFVAYASSGDKPRDAESARSFREPGSSNRLWQCKFGLGGLDRPPSSSPCSRGHFGAQTG